MTTNHNQTRDHKQDEGSFTHTQLINLEDHSEEGEKDESDTACASGDEQISLLTGDESPPPSIAGTCAEDEDNNNDVDEDDENITKTTNYK